MLFLRCASSFCSFPSPALPPLSLLYQLYHLTVFSLSFLPRRLSFRFCSLRLLPPQLLVFSLASFPILPTWLIPFLCVPSNYGLPMYKVGVLDWFCFCLWIFVAVYGHCLWFQNMVISSRFGVRLESVVLVRGLYLSCHLQCWCMLAWCLVGVCPCVCEVGTWLSGIRTVL